MSQKFRVKQMRVKSESANRSGIVTENMTSATPDQIVGTTFKNVQVNENGEFVVSTVSSTAPVMGGAGTTTVSNIGSNTADLVGTWTSDGGSTITTQGFVVYPSGNPSTIIGGGGVLNFPDGLVISPIMESATGLTGGTNYCFKPYAINSIGTSYGTELCFSTSSYDFFLSNNSGNSAQSISGSMPSLVTTYTPLVGARGITAIGGFLYTVTSGGLVKKDISTGTTMSTVAVPAGANQVVNDGTYLYVNGTNVVRRILISSFTLGGDVTLGGLGTGSTTDLVVFGTELYIATNAGNNNLGAVEWVNLTTWVYGGSIGGGVVGSSFGITKDATFVYVTSDQRVGTPGQSSVTKIDPSTKSIITTLHYAGPNMRLCDTLPGSIYIAVVTGNHLLKVDTTTMTLTTDTVIGSGISGVLANNGNIFVSSYNNSTLYKVNPTTNLSTSSLAVAGGPLAFNKA